MKHILSLIVFTFLLLSSSNGQSTSSLSYDRFHFDKEITVNGQRLSLNTFRGRPFIIELFSSTCIVCFRQLPKLQEMYQRYQGKVEFLLLGDEEVRLPKMYARFKAKFGLQFVTVFDSSLFKTLSPPSVPRYIWIDPEGFIWAETGPEKFTTKNIDYFLEGKYASIKEGTEKKYFNKDHLLPGTNYSYRSLFSSAIDSLHTYLPERLEYSDSGPFFQVINGRMADLYRYAYFDKSFWQFGDSLYGEVHPEVMIEGTSGASPLKFDEQRICYSITFAESRTHAHLQKVLRSDLENNFGYKATVETRVMPYHALIRKDSTNNSFCSTSPVTKEYSSFSKIEYKKVPIAVILHRFDYNCRTAAPFIDETGLTCPIDLSFEAVMTDLEDIRRMLEKAGFSLVTRYKPMKTLVLRPFLINVAANGY